MPSTTASNRAGRGLMWPNARDSQCRFDGLFRRAKVGPGGDPKLFRGQDRLVVFDRPQHRSQLRVVCHLISAPLEPGPSSIGDLETSRAWGVLGGQTWAW